MTDRMTCLRCNTELPIDAFPRSRADLSLGYQRICGNCLQRISRWGARIPDGMTAYTPPTTAVEDPAADA